MKISTCVSFLLLVPAINCFGEVVPYKLVTTVFAFNTRVSSNIFTSPALVGLSQVVLGDDLNNDISVEFNGDTFWFNSPYRILMGDSISSENINTPLLGGPRLSVDAAFDDVKGFLTGNQLTSVVYGSINQINGAALSIDMGDILLRVRLFPGINTSLSDPFPLYGTWIDYDDDTLTLFGTVRLIPESRNIILEFETQASGAGVVDANGIPVTFSGTINYTAAIEFAPVPESSSFLLCLTIFAGGSLILYGRSRFSEN